MGALTTSTLLVCATLAALFSRLPTFQRAYANHVQRMEDDEWLHGQCSNAEFFSRLRQHTGVCDQVRDTFNRPATLVALQACLPEIPWWGRLACCCSGVVVLPPGTQPYAAVVQAPVRPGAGQADELHVPA